MDSLSWSDQQDREQSRGCFCCSEDLPTSHHWHQMNKHLNHQAHTRNNCTWRKPVIYVHTQAQLRETQIWLFVFAVHKSGALFLVEILESGSFKSANGVVISQWHRKNQSQKIWSALPYVNAWNLKCTRKHTDEADVFKRHKNGFDWDWLAATENSKAFLMLKRTKHVFRAR